VHYKHLRPTLQLPLNFKRFSYLTHTRNIGGLLLLDFIENWRVSIKISLDVSLSLKLLV